MRRLPATLERRHWLCPCCLRPVIPGRGGNIQQHRDTAGNACEGSGLPFHTTGATITNRAWPIDWSNAS